MDQELERFKTEVNLSEFAAARGYALDRRESSLNSAVMRHPDGDKIVIARHEGGAWVYFSVRDDRDNGTVVDFLQNRGGGNLGEVGVTSPNGKNSTLRIPQGAQTALGDLSAEAPNVVPREVEVLPAQRG